MMDIDESYGISGPPFDDDDEPVEPVDERADAQDHNDNRREEYRISNR